MNSLRFYFFIYPLSVFPVNDNEDYASHRLMSGHTSTTYLPNRYTPLKKYTTLTMFSIQLRITAKKSPGQ